MKKKWIVVILLILCFGVGSYWYYSIKKNALPSGFIATNGRLILERIDVASLYPGRVKQIFVSEGQSVAKGDTLVSLSSEKVNANMLEAQAAKQRFEATVHRAEAETHIQNQQLIVADLALQNAKRMRQSGLISAVELVSRQAEYDAKKAAVSAAESACAEAQAGVAQAQAKIQEVASAESDHRIVAPINARVEYRIATLGNVIPAGGKVISLVDPSDVYMHLFLPTHTLATIKLNDEVRVVLDGIEAVFPARITFVSAKAQFTPKFVETSNERDKLMYKVRIQFSKTVAEKYTSLLKGGLTGNVYIRLDAKKEWPSRWNVNLPK